MEELRHAANVTARLAGEAGEGGEITRGDRALLRMAWDAEGHLTGTDPVARRTVIDALVERVMIAGDEVRIELSPAWRGLLVEAGDEPTSQTEVRGQACPAA